MKEIKLQFQGKKDETQLVSALREYLKEQNISASILLNSDVYINGIYISSADWETTSIYQDEVVEIFPNIHASAIAGGIIAALSASIGTVAATVVGWTVAIGVTIGASFALNWAISKVFPPDEPPTTAIDSQALPTITGANNQYRPYQQIPLIIGTMRTAPDFAVPYYSVINNGQLEIRHLFCVGVGEIDVWDIRKDDTPISSLVGIEYEIYSGWKGEPFKWFDNAPTTTQQSFSMRDYAVFKAESPINTNKVGFILTFPTGLRVMELSSSNYRGASVQVLTKLVNVDTGEEFNYMHTETNSNGNLTSWRALLNYDVPLGRWSIEVYTQHYLDLGYSTNHCIEYVPTGSESGGDRCAVYEEVWTAVPTYNPCNNREIHENNMYYIENTLTELQFTTQTKSVTYSGQSLTLIELKATASDVLTGGLNTINCMARLKGMKADGTLIASSNPALLTRRLLKDENILLNSQYAIIDDDSFSKFQAHCDRYGFTANAIETQGRTMRQIISDMLEPAQGYINGGSGVYEIFYDDPSMPIIDVINSRNSWGLSITRQMNILPVDGLKIQFNNAEKDYQTDEIPVHEKGVTPANVQNLSNHVITNSDMAYKYGMLNLAMDKLRGSVYKFSTDWRAITYKLGQRLLIQHPLFYLGIGTAGRVVDYVKTDTGGYAGVILDQFYPTDINKEYMLLESKLYTDEVQEKTWIIRGVADEETNILYFDVPIFVDNGVPQLGALLVFGESKQAGREIIDGRFGVSVIIRNITHSANFVAEIECVISDQNYYDAITGTIPPFESSLTFPTLWGGIKPSAPQILSVALIRESVVMDENGKIHGQSKITLSYAEKVGVEFSHYVIGVRVVGAQEYDFYNTDDKAQFIIPNVYQGVEYEIKVNAVSELGFYSEDVARLYQSADLISPLEKVQGFTTVYINQRINLVHSPVTDFRPFFYEIRRGVNFDSGQLISKSKEVVSIPILSSGTYWIKAISGTASSVEVSSLEVEHATGTGLPENVIATINEESTFWNGITTDFEHIEEDNSIRLDTGSNFRTIGNIRDVFDIRSSGYTGQEGTYYVNEEKTILLDSNHDCNIEVTYDVQAFSRNNNFRDYTNIRSMEDIRGVVLDGYYVNVDIQLRSQGIWSGVWQEFQPTRYIGDGFKFRIRAKATPNILVFIESFNVAVDVPDKIIEEYNITVPVEGLNYEFIPPFNKTPAVVPITLDNQGETDLLLEAGLIDRYGALFRIFDKQGNPVEKNINFVAKGY